MPPGRRRTSPTPLVRIIYIGKQDAQPYLSRIPGAGLPRSGAKRDVFVLKVDMTIADETFCEYYVYVVRSGPVAAPMVLYRSFNMTSAIR